MADFDARGNALKQEIRKTYYEQDSSGGDVAISTDIQRITNSAYGIHDRAKYSDIENYEVNEAGSEIFIDVQSIDNEIYDRSATPRDRR